MGRRVAATNALEQAFAAAFQRYFVGDPSFVRPQLPGGAAAGSLFVAAQSVTDLIYPQVAFYCRKAAEQVAGSSIYMAMPLRIIVDTALNERPDDPESLLNLHDDRVNKLFLLLENQALLMSLTNKPATGPDLRTVTDFQLYGIGAIQDESNTRQNNRLSFMLDIEIPFQPIGQ